MFTFACSLSNALLGLFTTCGHSQGVGSPTGSRMQLLPQSSSLLHQDSRTLPSASLAGRLPSLDAHILEVRLSILSSVVVSKCVTFPGDFLKLNCSRTHLFL